MELCSDTWIGSQVGFLDQLNVLFRRQAKPASPGATRVMWVRKSDAGVVVDADAALRYTAVWACVRVIAESIGSLPWRVLRRRRDGGSDHIESPINHLISTAPNPEMTAPTWIETMLAHDLTWGNAYSEIARDRAGRPVALWPIAPDRITVGRDEDGGIIYKLIGSDTAIAAKDMLHFKGLGFDGLVGYSPIQYAAQAIGLGLGTEKYGAAFFANGARPGGILEHPNDLNDEDYEQFKTSWNQAHGGPGKVNGTAILEGGMTWKAVGHPNDAAQFLETRKLQLDEIARFYRVPPHKIGIMDKATFSNIEQQSIEFVTDTLVPWMVRLESEVNVKLLSGENQIGRYSKFNVNALLRGARKERFDSYGKARQWGWLSVNDIRKLEDMSPIADGDQYLVPANMTTPELIEKEPEPILPPTGGEIVEDLEEGDDDGDSNSNGKRTAEFGSGRWA